MLKSDECKDCKFWRDWGLPFMLVCLFGVITLGYFTFTYYNDNQACLTVFNETAIKNNELARNLTICKVLNSNSDIDEIITSPNVFNFCQTKGFENGGYSSYSCTGVMCITSNIENGTTYTKTGCYKFSELVAYVR